jgi:hypothetical protein
VRGRIFAGNYFLLRKYVWTHYFLFASVSVLLSWRQRLYKMFFSAEIMMNFTSKLPKFEGRYLMSSTACFVMWTYYWPPQQSVTLLSTLIITLRATGNSLRYRTSTHNPVTYQVRLRYSNCY